MQLGEFLDVVGHLLKITNKSRGISMGQMHSESNMEIGGFPGVFFGKPMEIEYPIN